MKIPEISLPRVVILGGGFAGLNIAKRIDTKHYQVVMVDRHNYHTFQPLLYQVATSGLEPDSIAYPLRKTFADKKRFHFRMAEVKSVDESTKIVQTSIGDIRYDHLIIATGARSNYFGMENVERNAMPMKTLTQSLDLRSLILQNFEKALYCNDINEQKRLMTFVIVGGGPTGVELAGALAELKTQVLPTDYPDLDLRDMEIHLVEAAPKVLSAMSDHASRKADRFLDKMGVHLWMNTFVKDYDGQTVITSEREIPAETLIWAAGVMGAPIQGLNASKIGAANRIIVNTKCEVEGADNVYAVGDVSLMATKNFPKGLPMLGSVAMQQGTMLAKNFNAMAKGKKTREFKYKDKGTMATIGRNRAVVDLPFYKFSGTFAWFTWMFVHLMLLAGFRNRVVTFINWAWGYLRYDQANRLIVRTYRRNKGEVLEQNDV
ncbi:NAD(P)/FAD-dependent oxidoreductase [Persicobacter psychrovividus]|uniref:NADH:ubiquinone reductase (non-electrogenic) n=1 Tax=Persicobacter psychrovividus TaxID=387638 RepID=A0ABM7VF97_9BACT|nr:NADH dehydrogenase [Persicobacter psychrovividus]